jgi:LmbE family N-acetylglucosaminyl deacetylase
MRHVILAPHPDDAVLSLWHLLAGDADVAVVNVFGGSPDGHRGDAWWDRLTGAEDSVARVAERHAEDREALALTGREPVNLGLLDGQYREAEPDPQDIARQISEAAPEGLLLAPAALDAHRDHVLARAAALTLREQGREVALYADVPHATVYGWPAWVIGREADPHLQPQVFWERCMEGTGIVLGDLEAEVRRLEDAERDRKTAAVRVYRTQIPALEAEFHLLRPEIMGFEVTWRLP